MKRIFALALLLGGCASGRAPLADEERLVALHDDAPGVRDETFQQLLSDDDEP